MRYRFAGHELCTDTARLSGPDGDIHVEPQVFDVLVHLIRNRSRVVGKDELLDNIWESRFVSESALTTRIKAARAAVGDSGRRQEVIRTAHGKGYQFVAEITEEPVASFSAGTSSAGPVIRSLPAVANEFRGRARECVELRSLIESERLVTLIGPGGTGKTRMSIEVAAALPPDRSVVFVDLTAVRDEQALGQALAGALGIDAGVESDVVDACTAYLRARPPVVIIDNCEHVAAAAEALISRLLAEAPQVHVLATSRVPLGHPLENQYRLSPLPVLLLTEDLTVESARENAAVALFCDRASKVQQGFRLDDESLSGVASLCNALDGLPLAIELAAGRMGAFSLQDLVDRLDRRLDLLGDGRGNAEDRHRTLRATLNWSHDLLDAPCRRLFRFLSVFPAGLTLDGIEWLGARIDLRDDPLLVLNGLVESSLVGRTETPSGTRYVQLETMRAFGIDLLVARGEHDAAMDRAAGWALALTREMDETLRTPREGHWNDRIRREIPNIREGRHHLRARGRWSDLVAISANLDEWARLRDVSELWQWCDELLDIHELEGTDIGRALAVSALAAWRRGRIDAAADLARRSYAAAEDDWTRSRAQSAEGVARLFRRDLVQAAAAWDARADREDYSVDRANAALCRAYGGDPGSARREASHLLAAQVEAGWPTGIAWTEYVIGEIAAIDGDPESARWLESAIERAAEVGGGFTVGVAGVTLCSTLVAAGRTAEAASRYRDLIEHWLRSGTWTQQWTTLRNAAVLLRDVDPALCLEIMDGAAADPYAPELDPDAAADATTFVDEVRAAVGTERDADGGTRIVDRTELAERTRAALLTLV